MEMVNSPRKMSIMMMIGFKVLYSPEFTARKKMYLVSIYEICTIASFLLLISLKDINVLHILTIEL